MSKLAQPTAKKITVALQSHVLLILSNVATNTRKRYIAATHQSQVGVVVRHAHKKLSTTHQSQLPGCYYSHTLT
jgi:hypothetical protein